MRASRLDEAAPLAGLVLMVGLAACGGSTEVPRAGQGYGGVPLLDGIRVMVLPVQGAGGRAVRDADPEIEFALRERSTRTEWVFPAEIRSALQRSPALDVPIDALPVGMFRQGEVERVGDPLFGHLRRLAGLAGPDLAVIPVSVGWIPDELDPSTGAVQIAATLINCRNGRVFWFGIVAGETGSAPEDPRALASSAAALAARLVR